MISFGIIIGTLLSFSSSGLIVMARNSCLYGDRLHKTTSLSVQVRRDILFFYWKSFRMYTHSQQAACLPTSLEEKVASVLFTGGTEY